MVQIATHLSNLVARLSGVIPAIANSSVCCAMR
jgi:hypothetical protein